MVDDALAYVYSGEWVAECPAECGSVQTLFKDGRPAPVFHCVYCSQLAGITWPQEREMADMMAVLMRRPVPHTRNWYPRDHPVALKFRVPHGQSVRDLLDENTEHGVI